MMRMVRRWQSKVSLEVLCCPVSKQPLKLSECKQYLISEASNLAYPIIEGIPSLLPEAGIPYPFTKNQ